MALQLKHQTADQLAARFWTRLQRAFIAGKAGDRSAMIEYSRLIWRVAKMIDSGDLTSAQVRTSYNTFYGKSLTAGQWSTLVSTRFVPARDRYQAMLDETQV